MHNPFLVLGIPVNSDAQVVRTAYRRLAKHYHPDAVLDESQKVHAQTRMIELNLAYEEALKLACRPAARPFVPAGLQETLHLAERLYNQRMYASAVRILSRCTEHTAQWYYLYGQALYALNLFDQAHNCYRHAVRLSPQDKDYRQGALRAYQAAKREQALPSKALRVARDLLGLGNK
ncbi:MAG: DnaJ domain-containing protein [Oscillospiraceae bacterium]|jgi:tetratricopeptide (TPR) repeat protein|nr:DnaJ domain-containing protein [Oscillospiraceae bacterium]